MDYSILMSVYYKENPEFLKQAIESMLNQTTKSNDFVIVCDGKLTDELYEVLNFYESNPNNCIHRLQLDKNYGLGIALNKGLEICRNDLVARMDSDDISVSNRIETQLEYFQNNSKLSLCGSNIKEFNFQIGDTNIIKKVPCTYAEIIKYVKRRNPFNHMTVMFRKSIVQSCGSYEECYLNEDYCLWAKMISQNCYVLNIPESLVYMRVGNGMYERRGGRQYIRGDFDLQKKLISLGLINNFDFFVNIIIRSFIRLIPTSLRQIVYIHILRKG